jgi:hypothetical protein
MSNWWCTSAILVHMANAFNLRSMFSLYRFWCRPSCCRITGYLRWETKSSWYPWLVNLRNSTLKFYLIYIYYCLPINMWYIFVNLQHWEWRYWYVKSGEGWCWWLYFWGIRSVIGSKFGQKLLYISYCLAVCNLSVTLYIF